jgi:hypothetical protein
MSIQTLDIPQADRLSSVIQVIRNVAHGARTDVQIIANIPDLTADRQGRYYRRAAEILDFIVNKDNHAQLTPLGLQFMQDPVITNAIFINAVLRIDVIQRLIPYLTIHPEGLTKSEIGQYLQSIVVNNIGASMLPRRTNTIISWLTTLSAIKKQNDRYLLINSFARNLPILELMDLRQPILPVSGDLTEYRIIENRLSELKDVIPIYRSEAQMERARKAHLGLVNLVANRINNAGGVARSNELIDLATLIGEDYIFEMKSTNEKNERSQIRKGISQLYEYQYIQNLSRANLVLVIENPLTNENRWIIDYIENTRGIMLVWSDKNELYGTPKTRSKLNFLNVLSRP